MLRVVKVLENSPSHDQSLVFSHSRTINMCTHRQWTKIVCYMHAVCCFTGLRKERLMNE